MFDLLLLYNTIWIENYSLAVSHFKLLCVCLLVLRVPVLLCDGLTTGPLCILPLIQVISTNSKWLQGGYELVCARKPVVDGLFYYQQYEKNKNVKALHDKGVNWHIHTFIWLFISVCIYYPSIVKFVILHQCFVFRVQYFCKTPSISTTQDELPYQRSSIPPSS